ncbi:MAG: hypothetical protein QOE28_3212, partial [Solirubrobacteraceae bacterium]|nr:hypothetical protein [Solirubrobacteraceae bacterium]
MRRAGRALAAAAFAAVWLALVPGAPALAAPSLVSLGSFPAPVDIAAPPGDTRVFVVEQDGTVEVLDGGARKTFLDVSDLVETGGNEQGLLSIAFPPDYATSGLFYVFLVAADTGAGTVLELRRSATDPDAADRGSLRTVLSIPHPESANHYGGDMIFGPDGLLYISTGDGGNSNDVPVSDAEHTDSLRGKLLRIDPRQSGSAAHTNPAGNPFGNEVFAYGLRNPWRFSFDRATGDLVVADVGQGHREEIDFAPAAASRGIGANYGWRCFEGDIPTPQDTSPDGPVTPTLCSDSEQPSGTVAPVLVHRHGFGEGYCSITGGYVVRDPGLPTLVGRYLYGDFCRPELRSVALATGSATGDRAETSLPIQFATTFGEDACGRLYVAGTQAHSTGTVYRVQDGEPTPCSFPPPPAGGGGGAGGGSGAGPGGGSVTAADTRAPGLGVSVSGLRSLRAHRRLRLAL